MNQFYEDEVVLIADENGKTKRNIPMSEITKDSFEEVFFRIKKHLEDIEYWNIDNIVDKPKGDKQLTDDEYFKHEYMSSECLGEDYYAGTIYLPYKDKYIEISYTT